MLENRPKKSSAGIYILWPICKTWMLHKEICPQKSLWIPIDPDLRNITDKFNQLQGSNVINTHHQTLIPWLDKKLDHLFFVCFWTSWHLANLIHLPGWGIGLFLGEFFAGLPLSSMKYSQLQPPCQLWNNKLQTLHTVKCGPGGNEKSAQLPSCLPACQINKAGWWL